MAVHAQQPQTPVFRSSVEVTSIDVGAVDDRGRLEEGRGGQRAKVDGSRPAEGWIMPATTPSATVAPDGLSLIA
jgi:hypothetical protein